MKIKYLILVSFFQMLNHLATSQEMQKSLFTQRENYENIKKLWNNDIDEILSESDIFDKISGKTLVVGINACNIKDISKFNAYTDPSNNLKYVSTSYVLVNNDYNVLDIFTFVDFGKESNLLNVYNDFDSYSLTDNKSLRTIVNYISTSNWNVENVRILTIEEHQLGFFVLYENVIYVPNYQNLIPFVEYYESYKDRKDFLYLFRDKETEKFLHPKK